MMLTQEKTITRAETSAYSFIQGSAVCLWSVRTAGFTELFLLLSIAKIFCSFCRGFRYHGVQANRYMSSFICPVWSPVYTIKHEAN